MRLLVLLLMVLAGPLGADPVPGAAQALTALRASVGLRGLELSAPLQAMADAHAADMARRGYFSHQGADGSDIGVRAGRVGYRYCALAENIAKGQRSLDEVMSRWASSAGRRRNMLDRDVTEFGLARGPGNIWVMVLGARNC